MNKSWNVIIIILFMGSSNNTSLIHLPTKCKLKKICSVKPFSKIGFFQNKYSSNDDNHRLKYIAFSSQFLTTKTYFVNVLLPQQNATTSKKISLYTNIFISEDKEKREKDHLVFLMHLTRHKSLRSCWDDVGYFFLSLSLRVDSTSFGWREWGSYLFNMCLLTSSSHIENDGKAYSRSLGCHALLSQSLSSLLFVHVFSFFLSFLYLWAFLGVRYYHTIL